jgi:hypothetical protein
MSRYVRVRSWSIDTIRYNTIYVRIINFVKIESYDPLTD